MGFTQGLINNDWQRGLAKMENKFSKAFENVKAKVDETASSISANLKDRKEEREEKKKETAISKEDRDNLLITIIGQAVKVPGVKVNRSSFLREWFKEFDEEKINEIVRVGAVEAGVSKEDLKKKANKLITERVALTTGASFIAGLPGGVAMAVAIPADLLQFYGVAIRLAQEIAYLYGEGDIFEAGEVSDEKVKNQLVLYIGAMMGSTGAIKTVQVLTSRLAAQALKKLPQKALTKTFYYPIIKAICKAFGVAVTKESFAKGVSKIIPVAGGVVSGAITLASMIPMARRLVITLEKAKFDYTEADFEADWKDITEMVDKLEEVDDTDDETEIVQVMEEEFELTSQSDSEKIETKLSEVDSPNIQLGDALKQIKEAKEMLDAGILTEDEFSKLKARLLNI